MPVAPTKTIEDKLHDAEETVRAKNAEVNDLKKTLNQLRRENDTADKIRQEIYNLAAHTMKPPEWITGKNVKNGTRGGPITMWSDFHYGEVVNKKQVGGMNEFNPEIAHKRFTRLVDTTIDLCTNHMGRPGVPYPGIIICLGGDMLSGDIHEELMATNARTSLECIHDLVDMLGGGLDRMASVFGRVFVPAVVGNHGRLTKKPRFKGLVTSNFDWNVYVSLERAFRNDKRIDFMIPEEADCRFKMYGHRYLLTHGDNLGVKGGDGIIGAVGPIMRGVVKVGRQEAQIGRDFDTLLMGHYHQYITLPGLVVNNALKGYDEYAHLKLRTACSRPSQALWFTHPEHGITAHWQVYLEGRKKAGQSEEWVTWTKT